MDRRYTVLETLETVSGLTREQLDRYILAGVVQPVQTVEGPGFRDIDIARLNLLVELTEGFELNDDALGLVMSLLDQLHGLRGDMHAILDALAREPPEIRVRLRRSIHEWQVTVRR